MPNQKKEAGDIEQRLARRVARARAASTTPEQETLLATIPGFALDGDQCGPCHQLIADTRAWQLRVGISKVPRRNAGRSAEEQSLARRWEEPQVVEHAVAHLRELADSDFEPYDVSVPGSAPWLQKLARDDLAWCRKVGWPGPRDFSVYGTWLQQLERDVDLDSQWLQLEKCKDNFFAVLVRISGSHLKHEARNALQLWSGGDNMVSFLEEHSEIESVIRAFPLICFGL